MSRTPSAPARHSASAAARAFPFVAGVGVAALMGAVAITPEATALGAVAVVLIGVWPRASILVSLFVAGLLVAATHPLVLVLAAPLIAITGRWPRTVGAVVGLVALLVLAAAYPLAAAIVALLGAAVGLRPRLVATLTAVAILALAVASQPLAAVALVVAACVLLIRPRPVGAVLLVVALAVVAALWPWIAAPAVGLALSVLAYRDRAGLAQALRASARRTGTMAIASALLAGCILAFFLAVWPVLTLLALALVAVAVLAWTRPTAALILALLLFGLDGTIKILITHEGVYLVGPEAFGAGILDTALIFAVAGLVYRDRSRSLRAVWNAATGLERLVLLALPAWIVLSLLQTAQGGNIVRGLAGFRLSQAYVLVAFAGLIAFRHRSPDGWAIRGLLLVLGVVSGYAALQTFIGPAHAEFAYVVAHADYPVYGETVRTVGSLGSPVALASVVTPTAVFAIGLGLFVRNIRPLAWTVAALALVAAEGSYARVALVAVLAALLALWMLGLRFNDARWKRRTLLVLGAVGLVAVASTFVASRTSPQTEQRLNVFIHPGGDASLNARINTWRESLDDFASHPAGLGVGAVAHASTQVSSGGAGSAPTPAFTTDNSYLKVLVEQGPEGALLFLAGAFGLCVAVARRLPRLPPARRALCLASLAGFLSTTVLWLAGEYIEQPGKVLSWLLLGIAVGQAFVTTNVPRRRTRIPAAP
jgi:hypothetical protein